MAVFRAIQPRALHRGGQIPAPVSSGSGVTACIGGKQKRRRVSRAGSDGAPTCQRTIPGSAAIFHCRHRALWLHPRRRRRRLRPRPFSRDHRLAGAGRSAASLRTHAVGVSAGVGGEPLPPSNPQHCTVCRQYCVISRTTVVAPTGACARPRPYSSVSLKSYLLKNASNCSAPTVPSAASSSCSAS